VLALVRFTLDVGCLGWALRVRTPRAIRWFIAMNLLAAVAEEWTLCFGDVDGDSYTAVWVVMSLGIYWTMGRIVKEVLNVKPQEYPSRSLALIVAGAMTAIVAGTVLGHVLGPFDWVTLLDSAVLVFMGVCVSAGAAKQNPMWHKASLVLMLYWFAQALFEIGLTMHLWNPAWMRTNEWFPAILTCAGCVWVAHISRLPGYRMTQWT
jgi:hypothetical protein